MTPVRLEPTAPLSLVKHSTTEPLRSLLINIKMPTIVGILTLISMINRTSKRLKARNFFICGYFSFLSSWNFVLSWVEHEKVLYPRDLDWIIPTFTVLASWAGQAVSDVVAASRRIIVSLHTRELVLSGRPLRTIIARRTWIRCVICCCAITVVACWTLWTYSLSQGVSGIKNKS